MNLVKIVHRIKKDKRFGAAKTFVKTHKRGLKILILVLAAGGMIVNGIIQQPQIIANKEEIVQLREALEYEDERVAEVERLQEIVGTEEYIEKIARDKLGMVREDEKLFVDISKED